MARIRTIKPEFWTHPIMGKASDSIKCMAIAILNYADDEGYFLADPLLVRSSCRPFDDSSGTSTGLLLDLSILGWIVIKNHPEIGDIGHVVKFAHNQVISKPKPSKLKKYFESGTSPVRVLDCSGTSPSGNGKEWKGKEQGMERIKTLSEYSDDFLEFWSLYPSKVGKGDAWKSWQKVKPAIEPVRQALSWQVDSIKWKSGIIPNPATYINQRRWEDEPSAEPMLLPQRQFKTFYEVEEERGREVMRQFAGDI